MRTSGRPAAGQRQAGQRQAGRRRAGRRRHNTQVGTCGLGRNASLKGGCGHRGVGHALGSRLTLTHPAGGLRWWALS